MRTRTLLILSAVCGLLIVAAGLVKLLQVSSDPPTVSALGVGESSRAGDMTVSVEEIDVAADATVVRVTLSGVAGADALAGWRLWADGSSTLLDPLRVDDTTCDDEPVPPSGDLDCTVVFAGVDTVQGVIYLRAGEQRQWVP